MGFEQVFNNLSFFTTLLFILLYHLSHCCIFVILLLFLSSQDKEYLPLEQLKSEVCPRISPRDLVRITKIVQKQGERIAILGYV